MTARMYTRDDCRSLLVSLLGHRRSRQYKAGMLQAAVSFGVISQPEWQELSAMVEQGIAPGMGFVRQGGTAPWPGCEYCGSGNCLPMEPRCEESIAIYEQARRNGMPASGRKA